MEDVVTMRKMLNFISPNRTTVAGEQTVVTSGRFVRFAFAGGGATVIYFTLSNLFASILLLPSTTSSVLAYSVSVVFSYFAQSRYVFRVRHDSKSNVMRFIVSSLLGLLLSYGLIYVLTVRLGLSFILGTVAVCVAIPAISFILFSFWVFRPSSASFRPNVALAKNSRSSDETR